ncbi:Uncharacterised protein g4292 [Pycnogonum litorale]
MEIRNTVENMRRVLERGETGDVDPESSMKCLHDSIRNLWNQVRCSEIAWKDETFLAEVTEALEEHARKFDGSELHKAMLSDARLHVSYVSENGSYGNARNVLKLALETVDLWEECGLSDQAFIVLQNYRQYLEASDPCKELMGCAVRSLYVEARYARIMNGDQIMAYVSEVKRFIRKSSICCKHFINRLYQIGMECLKDMEYKLGITLLNECINILANDNGDTSVVLAGDISRVIAKAYLKWNSEVHWEDARAAVEYSESFYHHVDNAILRVICMAIGREECQSIKMEIKRLQSEIMEANTSDVVLLFKVLRPIYCTVCFPEIKSLLMTRSVQEDVCSGLLLKLLLLNGEMMEAGELLERNVAIRSDDKELLRLVQDRCTVLLESSDYQSTLMWLDYLERNAAVDESSWIRSAKIFCLLNMDDFERYVEQSDDGQLQKFVSLKRAIIQRQETDVKKHLCEILSESTTNYRDSKARMLLIEICLTTLTKTEDSSFIADVLEHLLSTSSRNLLDSLMVLCIQTFFRHKLSGSDANFDENSMEKNISLLESALNDFRAHKNDEDSSMTMMKISWNLAVMAGPENRAKLTNLCCEYLKLCDVQNDVIYGRLKTCLMMNAAACLHAARFNPDHRNQDEYSMPVQALQSINQCREIVTAKLVHGEDGNDPSNIYLDLFELEAKAMMKTTCLQRLIDGLMMEYDGNVVICQNVAAITQSYGCVTSSIRAIEYCLHILLLDCDNQTEDDELRQERWQHIARLYVCLIHMLLHNDCNDLVTYCGQVIEILNKHPKSFLQKQIYWIMSKVWNRGIDLELIDRNIDARLLCSVSKSLLKYLDLLGDTCRDNINVVYRHKFD